MTPVEAQAANMEQMPAPVGQVAVTLATVTRGPVAASVRYTGTALGYVEQDNIYTPAALCCFRHTHGNWAALKGLLFLHATMLSRIGEVTFSKNR